MTKPEARMELPGALRHSSFGLPSSFVLRHSSFFLVGPTGVGKTEVALQLAEQLDAEIVGADAFQIYAGLDILTAAPTAADRARVPHHLVGTIPLSEAWDVARYREAALRCIAEIEARGKRAVVVGGAGFYVRALTHGLAELPGADAALRAELEALPLEELQARYRRLDPRGAESIDLQNKRRLVRAVEVSQLTGRPFSSFRREWQQPASHSGILLLRERDELYRRIDAHVAAMFRAGVLDEVRALFPNSDLRTSISATASQTLGLREVRAVLAGEMSEREAVAAIAQATRRYAKRQLTWFRRDPSFRPVYLPTETSSLLSHLRRPQVADGPPAE